MYARLHKTRIADNAPVYCMWRMRRLYSSSDSTASCPRTDMNETEKHFVVLVSALEERRRVYECICIFVEQLVYESFSASSMKAVPTGARNRSRRYFARDRRNDLSISTN